MSGCFFQSWNDGSAFQMNIGILELQSTGAETVPKRIAGLESPFLVAKTRKSHKYIIRKFVITCNFQVEF